ncbi:hypothetical protein BJX61DRAFT_85801 [Aspergillus egyptiacus]|nr:hypothetical protein BJX61DRAFT_85801 [Aspergillus egyptiacus]
MPPPLHPQIQPALKPEEITSFGINSHKLRPPPSLADLLKSDPDLRKAYDRARTTAAAAYLKVRELKRHHDFRYSATCPVHDRNPNHNQDHDQDKVRLKAHTASIHHLRAWKADHNADDPTLAPSAKIPRFAIKLYISRGAYFRWAERYDEAMSRFVRSYYSEYCSARDNFHHAMDIARLKGAVSRYDFERLQAWWVENFLAEMEKWEGSVEGLVLPGYEQVVEEIYWAVIERVEEGEECWEEWCGGRPVSARTM